MSFRSGFKFLLFLAVWAGAAVMAFLVYGVWRDSNVSRFTIASVTDLSTLFDISGEEIRIKNPEILKICFTGKNVDALQDARQWFAGSDGEFDNALRTAGGRGDVFNAKYTSAIVLLTRHSAIVVQAGPNTLANLGCADAANGLLKKSGGQLYLPNASLVAPKGVVPDQLAPCERLKRFVRVIDDLLAETTGNAAPFDAAFGTDLPSSGCPAAEALSITAKSRHAVPPADPDPRYYEVEFVNWTYTAGFRIEKSTGNIIPRPLHVRFAPL